MVTWLKVENIVSTWLRVEGRGKVEARLRGRGSNVRIGFHNTGTRVGFLSMIDRASTASVSYINCLEVRAPAT